MRAKDYSTLRHSLTYVTPSDTVWEWMAILPVLLLQLKTDSQIQLSIFIFYVPMYSLHIATAIIPDIPAIRNLAMATWPVVYSPILSVAQIEYMLGTLYKASEIQRQMESGEQQYLLAFLNERPIGFAAFGPQDKGTYKLHKLYVLPDVHGTGAGKALLEEAVRQSREAGAAKLILNVHRSNPARGFYEKRGFRIYEVKDIPFGPGFVLNDYLMEKDLSVA